MCPSAGRTDGFGARLRKTFAPAILVASGAQADGGSASPKFFHYTNSVTAYTTTIDLERRAVFFVDRGLPASFCPDDSDHYCVDTPPFHFAVPKRTLVGVTEWTVMGHTYTMQTAANHVEILGRATELYIIDSTIPFTTGVRAIRYFYSPEVGLVGYQISGTERGTEPEVLQDAIGFGARGTVYDVQKVEDQK